MTNQEPTDPARDLLVEMLEQAGQLEHCLLDSYLYAACSIKSTPQEWADAGNERENRRRAILFERARAWKQALLGVARDEMVHMHYVACLRRGLGERPALSLPERDPKTKQWIVPNWKARVGSEPVNDGKGVKIPVEGLSDVLIRKFVVYESTDALQNADPFAEKQIEMFRNLFDIEQDLAFERMLFAIPDIPDIPNIPKDERRARLKKGLAELYAELTPVEPDGLLDKMASVEEPELPPLEDLHFQSIADFYYKGIQPLYDQAFDRGWVKHNNYLLNNEVVGDIANEGFLGKLLVTGPVHRDKNFSDLRGENAVDPLDHMDTVDNIIRQIVEEGEGATGFEKRAEAFITWYADNGGTGGAGRRFQQALNEDSKNRRNPSYSTPPWLSSAQLLRESHLYRFAMVMIGLDRERELAQKAGIDFKPARTPVKVEEDVSLQQMTKQLPEQFNACYLVLMAWLSRIYELQTWEADKPRRLAIEMVATWPLMSMAIRPMLELASFFPVDTTRLFRWDRDALPMLPTHAQQLRRLYLGEERNQEINEEMDYLAVRVLADVASWASGQLDAVRAAPSIGKHQRTMIITRLEELGHLDEFRKQFPFRVAGGYSNVAPDDAFAKAAMEPKRFEESPKVLFENTLALRLRFSGWGMVQLATDPDPTWDEVGCTGTAMLHAADGDRRFDTALVWQNSEPDRNILRGPEGLLPPLGVQCREASLLVVSGKASAGYVPLQVLNSSGAVQTSGVQQKPMVSGFDELLSLSAEDIVPGGSLPVELLAKDGVRPFLNGLNHLVWRDGEPIDPFVFSLGIRDSTTEGGTRRLFEREIFNEGKTILDMSPLQRQNTLRAPVGFDSYRNLPGWVMASLRPEERDLMRSPSYPANWLSTRALGLADELEKRLIPKPVDQRCVDQVVSLAERMRLVSVPKGTTFAWPQYLLHYGHTVSGPAMQEAEHNPILHVIKERTGLPLKPAVDGSRHEPNTRWFLSYTKGIMDTDSLRDLVYGELYVPVSVVPGEPIHLTKSWSFVGSMRAAVEEYACRFDNPYWAPEAKVEGNKRTIVLSKDVTIVETLEGEQRPSGYAYRMAGFPGISDYEGRFTLEYADKRPLGLSWSVVFKGDSAAAVVAMLGVVGSATRTMTQLMNEHFGPDGQGR